MWNDNEGFRDYFVLNVVQIKQVAYVGPRYCRAEMYTGRVACCPLVSHEEYAPCALLTLEKNTLPALPIRMRVGRYRSLYWHWPKLTLTFTPRALSRLEKRRTNGRQTDGLRLPLEAVSVIKIHRYDTIRYIYVRSKTDEMASLV